MNEEQVTEVFADAEVTQSVADDWRSSIPEEIRGHKSLDTIKDVGSLAKGYVNAQSMIGADKIALPGKHATDDDWNNVYTKLGRPEEPSGYELSNNLPEGQEPNEKMLEWFKGTAHKAGLSPRQAQIVLQDYNEMNQSQSSVDTGQAEQMVMDTETELKKEYGQAFEDRMSTGNAVAKQFGAEGIDEIQLADGRTLGDHPDIIKMMVNIGQFMKEKMGEDTLEGVKSNGAMAPSEAAAKLAEIRAPGGPLWDARHPEHDWYVQESLRLTEITIG